MLEMNEIEVGLLLSLILAAACLSVCLSGWLLACLTRLLTRVWPLTSLPVQRALKPTGKQAAQSLNQRLGLLGARSFCASFPVAFVLASPAVCYPCSSRRALEWRHLDSSVDR